MVMDIWISLGLLVVGIAVLVVIHMAIVRRLFRVRHQNGPLVHRLSTALNSRVLSIEDVNRLPCFDYYAGESTDSGIGGGGGAAECAVCLEAFKGGDKCRLLPNCGHSFHVQCIDSWLLKTPACPICRTLVEEHSARGGKEGVVEGSNMGARSGSGGDIVLELT
ncbi:hypothetical protein MLD38_027934 [Melastoma candidum]|uniref:Uncharacterized protein n=1 Tax=Melastoma candidum TaxID=119954 RepID=A0ACB9MZN2_9MYRT|nr:hypothetical protein MLD38_027934 [Melastoma candidum]